MVLLKLRDSSLRRISARPQGVVLWLDVLCDLLYWNSGRGGVKLMRRTAGYGRLVALGLLPLVALASCRTPDFADVAQGPTAELVLLNESGRVADAALYQDPAICRGRSLVRPAPTPGLPRRVTVRADEEVTVSFFQDIGLKSSGSGLAIEGCAPTLTFRAEAGSGYAVRYRNCTADVVQVSQDGASLPAPRPVDARQRAYVRAFDDAGRFCRD